MYKRILAFVVILVVAAGAAFAQQTKIPYVDIEEARGKIQTLEDTNTKMKAEIDESRAANSELEDQIEEWQKQINEIDFILVRVKEKGSDLYEIYSDIVDKTQKANAHEAIEKNRDLRSQLEAKIKVLEKQIADAQKEMDSNSKTVGINNNKISRNADEINLLNASIEKTEAQKEVLTSYIDNVNEINSEAESFLGAAK
jgi:chromosome segregation ATPase